MNRKPTSERLCKMERILAKRQDSLRVVVEEVKIVRNLSAILRTCDSVGVQFVHVVHSGTTPLILDKHTSAGAHKWISIRQHATIEECIQELKQDGFLLYATHLGKGAKSFHELDYTGRVAIIFGNEHHGVSKKALELSDNRLLVPQVGFSNSLNVGVAAAAVLYEAFKQRTMAGLYEGPQLTDEQAETVLTEWQERISKG